MIEYKDRNVIALTRGQFDVAFALANAPKQVFSRAQLQDTPGAIDSEASTRSVKVVIARLRRKLGHDSKSGAIRTVPGMGYRQKRS
jgi:two-component system OmpR family response regulator